MDNKHYQISTEKSLNKQIAKSSRVITLYYLKYPVFNIKYCKIYKETTKYGKKQSIETVAKVVKTFDLLEKD